MKDCCEAFVDVYIMPYWDTNHLIGDSINGMEVPKYCPLCRRKLHHTRDFDLQNEQDKLNSVGESRVVSKIKDLFSKKPKHLPYPVGKK